MSTGILNTNFLPQDLAKKSFAGLITRLAPNGTAPLFALTSMLKTETAAQPEHGFFTKTAVFPAFAVSADVAATDTVLTVTSTANLIPGQIHQFFETKENVIINEVISATQIRVTRGVGNVDADTIAIATDNVNAYQVSNAHEEASLRPNPLAIQAVRVTNLTQIFRNTWSISDTLRATLTIAGDSNVAENKQDAAAFHAGDIEKAIFFGQKSQGFRNGQPFRTMDGLVSIVGNLDYYPPSYSVPNVHVAGATTNFTQLETMLDTVFDQATDPKVANERLLFVGGAARRVLNGIGRLNGEYQLIDGQTNFGLQFQTFKTARGTFRLIEHPLFNSNPDWSRTAVAVDLSTFNLAYLGDRKTKNKEFNLDGTPVDNGIDAVGGTLTTEVTALVKNPPANAIIYNLTAAAQG